MSCQLFTAPLGKRKNRWWIIQEKRGRGGEWGRIGKLRAIRTEGSLPCVQSWTSVSALDFVLLLAKWCHAKENKLKKRVKWTAKFSMSPTVNDGAQTAPVNVQTTHLLRWMEENGDAAFIKLIGTDVLSEILVKICRRRSGRHMCRRCLRVFSSTAKAVKKLAESVYSNHKKITNLSCFVLCILRVVTCLFNLHFGLKSSVCRQWQRIYCKANRHILWINTLMFACYLGLNFAGPTCVRMQ